MTNCPNCGGVIDLDANKCAYCGTPYYDLSCVPLHEPFFLRLNVGTKDKPQIIMQKVFTTGVKIEHHPDYCTAMAMDGRMIREKISQSVEYELTFVGLNEYKVEKGN